MLRNIQNHAIKLQKTNKTNEDTEHGLEILITMNDRALTAKMSSMNLEAFGVCTDIWASELADDEDDGDTCFDVIASESVGN